LAQVVHDLLKARLHFLSVVAGITVGGARHVGLHQVWRKIGAYSPRELGIAAGGDVDYQLGGLAEVAGGARGWSGIAQNKTK
jgi:hypothetical protein